MKALMMVTIAALLAPAATAAASAPPPTRRFAVVAGANRGPADRVALRYAVADADRFAKLVTGMGGVASEDCVVLREPPPRVPGRAGRGEDARGRAGHRRAGRRHGLLPATPTTKA